MKESKSIGNQAATEKDFLNLCTLIGDDMSEIRSKMNILCQNQQLLLEEIRERKIKNLEEEGD